MESAINTATDRAMQRILKDCAKKLIIIVLFQSLFLFFLQKSNLA